MAEPIRAAQYLRMSTEHQKYSPDVQASHIAAYAAGRGYEIVRTYSDLGVSGLHLKTRKGLRRLLADAVSGSADFSVILVYDVSRWGRFQDPDQSAHYEFLCREAGLAVEYCAEMFENDGALASVIIKNLKRVMAAEFSRELSEKVKAGKLRVAAAGYWLGGQPGYGLRRLVVDEQGAPLQLLAFRERKAVHGYRVLLVAGPEEEQAVVRRIYREYVNGRLSRPEIAGGLNRDGVVPPYGRPWTEAIVRNILTREVYVGDLVYRKTMGELAGPRRRAPSSYQLRIDGAIKPFVSRQQFEAARALCSARDFRGERDWMRAQLSALYLRLGYLTASTIDAADGLPSSQSYAKEFGTLPAAYAEVGCDMRNRRFMLAVEPHRAQLEEIIAARRKTGAGVVGYAIWRAMRDLGCLLTYDFVLKYVKIWHGSGYWRDGLLTLRYATVPSPRPFTTKGPSPNFRVGSRFASRSEV